MKKTVIGLLLIAGCFIVLYMRSVNVPQTYKFSGFTMGTAYTVKIVTSEIDDANLIALEEKVKLALLEVNRQMSTYMPTSEISQFNKSRSTDPFNVSADFARVMLLSQKVSRDTNGTFDPTVSPLINAWGFGPAWNEDLIPSDEVINDALKKIGYTNLKCTSSTLQKSIPELSVNLGAIAKGFGVDKIAEVVKSFGYKNYMVEIGGEVVTAGVNLEGVAWRIGIEKPVFGSEVGFDNVMAVSLPAKAIATSGDYRKFIKVNGKVYSHVIDPRTGYPTATNVASASVIADSCVLADALATSLMVLGPKEGLALIEKYPNVEAFIAVRMDDGSFNTYKSSGFDKFIVQ